MLYPSYTYKLNVYDLVQFYVISAIADYLRLYAFYTLKQIYVLVWFNFFCISTIVGY